MMESRRYWVLEGYLSARSRGCAEGLEGLECPRWTQNRTVAMGWALAIPM